ncbi:prefoldin subunit 1-like [Vulpes lagopus]|uniref:prefoldin subunit 1-like n=1 Tax=Vulpes lagopus TaxID=494514 RepID=UPI001BCA1DF7|nr:prefoldin subunit 1-like [Vulpes lagopus]
MVVPVDLELKKAFTELEAKVIDTQQKVKLADTQIEQINRTKKHAHLTDTEIMTLVDETNVYEGVGRMFILQSKEVINSQLVEKQKIAEEKIKELQQKKSYLEWSVKEAEGNIWEMLMAVGNLQPSFLPPPIPGKGRWGAHVEKLLFCPDGLFIWMIS